MKNKRGETIGDSLMMMYQVFFVAFVAFVILGVSAMLYNYNINTRDSETMLIARSIVDCVAPEGFLDLDSMNEEDKNNIFSFCGFDDKMNEAVFVSLGVMDGENKIDKIVTGNEGLLWVNRIYTSKLKTASIEKYEPGYFNGEFFLNVLKDGQIVKRNIIVEVILKDEE